MHCQIKSNKDMETRELNKKVITLLLSRMNDNTMECTGKLKLSIPNSILADFNVDRIVLEYEDDVINGLPSTKNVWLDEITENEGVVNTCLLDDLSDKDIEKVLGVFNPNMVDAAKKYFVFTSEKHMEPSFAVCNVVYNDDDPSNIMNDYKIKFSCDYNEDDDDDFAYFCNDFVNIFDLFTEGSGSDFTIVSVVCLM